MFCIIILGGFYRHIYEQKLGPKTVTNNDSSSVSVVSVPTPSTSTSIKPEKEDEVSFPIDNSSKLIQNKKERIYRKRKLVENDKSDDEDKKQPEHLQYNLDADSDFSIDSDSDDDNDNKVETENLPSQISSDIKIEIDEVTTNIAVNPESDDNATKAKQIKDEIKMPPPPSVPIKEPIISTPIVPPPPKVKIDKWKKRTVDDVFDAAVQRYFERKALRTAS